MLAHNHFSNPCNDPCQPEANFFGAESGETANKFNWIMLHGREIKKWIWPIYEWNFVIVLKEEWIFVLRYSLLEQWEVRGRMFNGTLKFKIIHLEVLSLTFNHLSWYITLSKVFSYAIYYSSLNVILFGILSFFLSLAKSYPKQDFLLEIILSKLITGLWASQPLLALCWGPLRFTNKRIEYYRIKHDIINIRINHKISQKKDNFKIGWGHLA